MTAMGRRTASTGFPTTRTASSTSSRDAATRPATRRPAACRGALFFEARLHELPEKCGAERQRVVIEVVAGVVDLAAALHAGAVADVDVAARHPLEHVGEVFRAHHEVRVAV